MSNLRMITTVKRTVFMAHLCSNCGFPMITAVTIESEAVKAETAFGPNAREVANETAEEAVCNEVMRIKSCYKTKEVIVKDYEEKNISYGHYYTVCSRGVDSKCPICSNIEPWKSVTSKKKIDELNKKNFPVVFKTPERAENWAYKEVNSIVTDIAKKREDSVAVKKEIENVIELEARIKYLYDRLDSITEIAEYKQLKEKLSSAEKIRPQLGIFDVKNKRIVNKRIKTLKTKIEDLNKILEIKKNPIEEKISVIESKLLASQLIAFGCSDKVLNKNKADVFSYFPCPNDIPMEIANEIKHFNQKSSQNDLKDITGCEKCQMIAAKKQPLFCRKCGYKLLDGSKFCTKCGAKVG